MTSPQYVSGKLTTILVVILALATLALVILAPGFLLDNNLVYGGF
jgi:hypothetical protein